MCHLMLSFINSWSAMTVGSCFQAISRRFWGGLCFVLLVGFCTKRRPWPNSSKTATVIVPHFCFGRESCSCCFRRILKDFEAILKGVFALYFWWDFVQNEDPGQIRWKPRKYHRSPLLLQARIMFDLFSSDFKTILKGSSFLGHRSSFCTHPVNSYINF